MKKVTCTNGHFFDADRFDSCPICGQGRDESELKSEALGALGFESEETVPLPQSCAIDELAATAWISPDEMRRLWEDDLPAEEETPEQQEPAEEPEETAPLSQLVDELAPTMWTAPDLDISPEDEEGGGRVLGEADAVDFMKADRPGETEELAFEEVDTPASEESRERTLEETNALVSMEADTPEMDALDSCPEEALDLETAPETEEICEETLAAADESDVAAQPQMTLAQAVAASDAVGMSPVFQTVQQKAAEPTVNPVGLPVGWLVGLSDSIRGKGFPCKSGRNRIGRERQMDISVPEALAVDPVNHAQIIYEPKKRQFFIQAGNGDGLTYLNDELVFTHEELRAYDRISLGEAAFVFLPPCGERFDWDTNTCGE